MQIRSATVADAHGIAEVHVRAWQEAYAHLLPLDRLMALVPEERVERWRRTLDEDEEQAWVAIHEDQIVGWATASSRDVTEHPRARELNGLYCVARVHGSGAGQSLLDAAIGVESAFLWSAADNPRAAAFYRKNGFELDGEQAEYPMLGTSVAIARWVR
jgi:L-amino acid N-acyltransferase YncA